jgi:hypothetical protein
MGLSEITYLSVVSAIEEYDQKGQDNFLQEYGYQDARQFFLIYKDRRYPSKAIAGVAYKFVRPGNAPLLPSEFSGGRDTVEKKLQQLGFIVESGNISDVLILVENEVTFNREYDHWEDLTGLSYQFPNQYKNKFLPGKRFIYYRGVRRSNNKRGQAEYFGTGKIASIWRDPSVPLDTPKAKWKWYCSIDEYIPFLNPVPIQAEGVYFEKISTSLGWRTGVREIHEDVYFQIISLGGIQPTEDTTVHEQITELSLQPETIPINKVQIIEAKVPLDGFIQSKNVIKKSLIEKTSSNYRRSRQSKQIGDRAEEIVFEWLRKHKSKAISSSVRWIAHEGITPGWDIEFCDEKGQTVGVEVKGTTASIFPNIEITAQELAAAKLKRENYWLVLVSECLGIKSKINVIIDPYSLIEKGELIIEPLIWRVRK